MRTNAAGDKWLINRAEIQLLEFVKAQYKSTVSPTRALLAFRGISIKEWFYRRPNLPTAHTGHIVLEKFKIRTAHISLDLSANRVHRHETRPKEHFLVKDRVARRHRRVDCAFIGKHLHVDRTIERIENLAFRHARFLHHAVSLALANGTIH